MRQASILGDIPSASEYIKLVNASVSGGDLHVEAVEVTAPALRPVAWLIDFELVPLAPYPGFARLFSAE